MKYLLLPVLIVAFVTAANGQSAKNQFEIYRLALDVFMEQVDSFYATSPDDPDWRTIFLHPNQVFLHPDSIRGRKIVEVKKENLYMLYAMHDNKLIQINISGISLDSDTASVVFYVVDTKYDPQRFDSEVLSMKGFTKVYFGFDCASKGWKHARTVNERFKQS